MGRRQALAPRGTVERHAFSRSSTGSTRSSWAKAAPTRMKQAKVACSERFHNGACGSRAIHVPNRQVADKVNVRVAVLPRSSTFATGMPTSAQQDHPPWLEVDGYWWLVPMLGE